MPAKTYKTRALVLRKTKLREKDLIVSMLDESGALLQGVAKGARKPGGSLAARLELFSTADLLMARGRSLDVVCEARLDPGSARSLGLEASACAGPVAELLCLVVQPDLPQPRLFDLSRAAIARIACSQPSAALLACAAALWKIMSLVGFRPSLRECALCGDDIGLGGCAGDLPFSPADGGIACEACPRPPDALLADADALRWCDALIRARFDEIAGFECDRATAFVVLDLARAWVRSHVSRDLKSLDFLVASGLF